MKRYCFRGAQDKIDEDIVINAAAESMLGMSEFERSWKKRKVKDTTDLSVEDGKTGTSVEDDNISPDIEISPDVGDSNPGFSGDPVPSIRNGAGDDAGNTSSLSSEAGGSSEGDDNDSYKERVATGIETVERLFDHCDGKNFKNGWTFDFIKSTFATEPNLRFFEHVMCAILGLKLKQSLKLSDFVQFLLLQNCSSPVEHISSGQIDILGRRVDVTSSERRSSSHKEIVRLQLVDDNISASVFQISSPSTCEFYFYNSIKELVRSGDISGVPLMVSGKEESGHAQFVIPDYGYSLRDYISTYSCDKSLLTLSLLATCCCLPANHMDSHDGNVCIYLHNTPFRYNWTLQTTTFVIELSWINNGILTFIDWEHYKEAGTKASSSTASWVYKRDGWKMEIQSNSLGLTRLSLSGEDGLWQLLHTVLQTIPKEKGLSVKYVQNTLYERNPVATLLQVFPEYPPADVSKPLLGIPEQFLNRWNQRMSDHGGKFKAKTSLSARDLRCLKELYFQIINQGTQVPHTLRSVCPIPSDTGLVCLKCDNTLIANADIAPGAIVTYLPTARKIRPLTPEINPYFEISVHSATVIRKIAPFVGFGGFTKWGPVEEANCTISIESPESKLHLFALRAVRTIIKGEEIVCKNTFLRNGHTTAAINDSIDGLIKEVRKKIQCSSVTTRRGPPGQTVSTQQN